MFTSINKQVLFTLSFVCPVSEMFQKLATWRRFGLSDQILVICGCWDELHWTIITLSHSTWGGAVFPPIVDFMATSSVHQSVVRCLFHLSEFLSAGLAVSSVKHTSSVGSCYLSHFRPMQQNGGFLIWLLLCISSSHLFLSHIMAARTSEWGEWRDALA